MSQQVLAEMRKDDPKFTCLDLFSGAGGVSLGLEAAGFRSIGGVEIDPVAAETYRRNFGQDLIYYHGPKHGDIRHVSMADIRKKLESAGYSELDLLVAAPPCQGFSRIGRGKLDSKAGHSGSFLHDPRNLLYEQAIKAIGTLRPKAVLFENVAGILHLRGNNVAEHVCRAIDKQGYRVRCALLNSAWYGVPQIRERIVIVAFRNDLYIDPAFPRREHTVRLARGHLTGAELDPNNWEDAKYFVSPDQIQECPNPKHAVSAEEALGDLPEFTEHLLAKARGTKFRALRPLVSPVPYKPGRPTDFASSMRHWSIGGDGPSESVSDHFCRWTPRDFEIFRSMEEGDRYPVARQIGETLFEEAKIRHKEEGGPRPIRKDYIPPYKTNGFPDKWRKLIRTEPSWTITAHLGKDTYSHIHYDSAQARTITIREAARLQSFPDRFNLAGNMGDAFRQIGNAVPPLLALAIGRSIQQQLVNAAEHKTRESAWKAEAPTARRPLSPESPWSFGDVGNVKNSYGRA